MPTTFSTVYAASDAVSRAEMPTAAATAHTSTPVQMPAAVAIAWVRPCVTALRSTSAVSSPGVIVIRPATTAKPSSADSSVMP